MRSARRLGIALGSLVAASLIVGLVGGVLLPGPGSILATLVVVILGALIYRDIIRREEPSS